MQQNFFVHLFVVIVLLRLDDVNCHHVISCFINHVYM